jgi:hypothetical protein
LREMTTIADIYAAINPLPAMLSAKGKVKPEAILLIDANGAHLTILLKWDKPYRNNSWEQDCEYFSGENFDEAFDKAISFVRELPSFVRELPSAEQAKLHHFMRKLGNLIDAGKDEGIEVDYLNPLLDTMKRLSENVITYRPQVAS